MKLTTICDCLSRDKLYQAFLSLIFFWGHREEGLGTRLWVHDLFRLATSNSKGQWLWSTLNLWLLGSGCGCNKSLEHYLVTSAEIMEFRVRHHCHVLVDKAGVRVHVLGIFEYVMCHSFQGVVMVAMPYQVWVQGYLA